MKLKDNWQYAVNSFLVCVILFVTSVNIDLGGAVINVNSLHNVMKYNQQWVFIGSEKQYDSFIDREIKLLQDFKKELLKSSTKVNH